MMKHYDDPQYAPDFKKMSTEDILLYFKKYEFRDSLGHDLLLCNDFLMLVSSVAGKNK